LKASLPEGVRATIIADRGFGDRKRYEQLTGLGFDFIVRFRQDILLTEKFGEQRPASEWLHETGRARLLKNMAVTADCYVLPAVVVVHDKRMKDPWCLATNRSDLKAAEIVQLYGKRFTIVLVSPWTWPRHRQPPRDQRPRGDARRCTSSRARLVSSYRATSNDEA
jgi:hypothetical protein